MIPPARAVAASVIIAAALAGPWCMLLWQPQRQIRLHQRHLLKAAEQRDFKKIYLLLDDSFRTPGGLEKAAALRDLAEVLRPFLTLEITASETELDENAGRIRELLRIEGLGDPLVEPVKTAVNHSGEPFAFTWRRKSWKPWDWRLVSASHPLIDTARFETDF